MGPRATAVPPVMYSQKWSPAPSTPAPGGPPGFSNQNPPPAPPRPEPPPAGRAVADGVAGQHGIGGGVAGKGLDCDHAAAHALADVILRLAFERELDAIVEEGAEALACASLVAP